MRISDWSSDVCSSDLAGVTPFIAIFRQLYNDGKIGSNQLICSNKTEADIILKDEFTNLLGENFINTITNGDAPGYHHGRIDEAYLKDKITDFDRDFSDRKSTRLNSSHQCASRMPSSDCQHKTEQTHSDTDKGAVRTN